MHRTLQKWPQISPTLTEAPLPNMTLQLLSSRGGIFCLRLESDPAHVVSGTLANVIQAKAERHLNTGIHSHYFGSPVITMSRQAH